jgi:hypothetical protein
MARGWAGDRANRRVGVPGRPRDGVQLRLQGGGKAASLKRAAKRSSKEKRSSLRGGMPLRTSIFGLTFTWARTRATREVLMSGRPPWIEGSFKFR